MVGTDQAKDQVFASLQKSEAGAGYIHIPQSVDEEFCNQLTAEKRVTTYKRGFPVPVYKKIRPRNEALDLMVYALAVLEILQPDYAAIERRITNAAEPQQKTEQQKDDVSVVRHRRPVKRRSSFINDW
jgi:phage terminase large subunit GpA-like protein